MSKNQTALLIVDMQAGFLNPSLTPFMEKVQNYIDNVGHRYDKILATKFINPKPSKWRELLDWERCGENTQDTDIKIRLPKNTQIIEKPSYGLIHVKNAFDIFKDQQIVDILGVDTDACVLSCAMDLFDMNIKVQVLSDLCCSTQGERYHYIALEILRRNLGQEQIRSSHTIWKGE